MVPEDRIDAIIRKAIRSHQLDPPRSDVILQNILREIRKDKKNDGMSEDGRDKDDDGRTDH